MGSGGLAVHIGGPGGTVAESDLHIFLHDIGVVDLDFSEIFDEDSFVGALLQLHPGLHILSQQVMDFFIVNFDETAPNEMGLGSIAFGDSHDLAEGPGDNTLALLGGGAHHGVRFAAAGLPVGEDGAVITVEYVVD